MRNRFVITILLLFFAAGYSTAADMLPKAELLQERSFTTLPETTIAPDWVAETAEQFFDIEKITVGAEFLYTISRVAPDLGLLELYNEILKYSTMKGLVYRSTWDDKEYILINESYAIGGQRSRKPLPDPVMETIPEQFVQYVYQDIREFGESVWRGTYSFDGSIITVDIENTDDLWFGPFKVVSAGKMKTLLVIFLQGNDALIYQAGSVHSGIMEFLSFIGMKDYLETTFFDRLKAQGAFYSR